jgi:NAD dependent epimerase/dehydratase family enzyme
MAEVLFDSLRVVPEAPQQAGFSFDYPTVSAAFAVLF